MPRRLAIAAVMSLACERAPTRTPTVAPTPSSPRRTTEIPELFEGADGRFGFRNRAGGIALAPGYLAAYPFTKDGVAHVVDETGWACIDTSGRVLLRPFVYDNGPDYLEEGLARYVDGGKVGWICASPEATRFACGVPQK